MTERLRPGSRNAITDVGDLLVGNASDPALKSGVTVLTRERPFTVGMHVMGGAPGTRETDLLAPDKTVRQVDALVLSGGSAFGLEAASGVVDELRTMGRGFAVGDARVPVVPAAILFDLLNGGDKAWVNNPYPALGREALNGCSADFGIGSTGAGTGATTASLKGGLGTASVILPDGPRVGALAAVNALGSAIVGHGPHFWAAPWELEAEFGGLGPAPRVFPDDPPHVKGMMSASTTIAIVATDAALDKAQCSRVAIAAHDGIARALVPSHTPMDGDLVFAASAGKGPMPDTAGLVRICHAAAICLARAVARGVFEAEAVPGDTLPCWRECFGR